MRIEPVFEPASVLSLAGGEIFLTFATLFLLVLGVFLPKNRLSLLSFGGIASLVLAAILVGLSPHGRVFQGAFVSDASSQFTRIVIYLSSGVALFLAHGWLLRSKDFRFEYVILLLLAVLGMGMMVASSDLISLYLGIELQSLAFYILCAFRRDEPKASEAGLKYFVLGALSSGILLYGASLIYGFSGATSFATIAEATKSPAGSSLIFGLVFLLCGLAFKVSAAPFHMWTPDVYEGAPTAVVAFMSAAPKLAAMVLIARILKEAFPYSLAQWQPIIVALALISITVGAFGGLVQQNLKRLLAYSSIANIGYALLGLAAGTVLGLQDMLVFMLLYLLDVMGFFACLLALSREGKPMETLSSFAGLVRLRPGLGISLTLLSLSVLGLPPLSGFWAKFYVFRAAVVTPGLGWVAVYGLVLSVVSAFYYLRLVKLLWFDPPLGQTDVPPLDAKLVAFGAAAFAFPLVMPALAWLDPVILTVAQTLGQK